MGYFSRFRAAYIGRVRDMVRLGVRRFVRDADMGLTDVQIGGRIMNKRSANIWIRLLPESKE
jgi:hypothetical protein